MMEEYEYAVTIRTNGERHLRYIFAGSKADAEAKAEASFIASVGYRQEVNSAMFTGRVMRDGILR